MTERSFEKPARQLTLREIVALTGAKLAGGVDAERRILAIAAPELAGPSDLCFVDDRRSSAALEATQAGACLTSPAFAQLVPPKVAVLTVDDPYRAFVEVAQALFPDALRPSSLFQADGDVGAIVHASARLESNVIIDPSAVVGPHVEIGGGTAIGPGAVIGPGVSIGRECEIGAASTILHALLGDRVFILPGCHIGQDGLAVQPDAKGGRRQVPQLGRVILQDEVRIGAGTTS